MIRRILLRFIWSRKLRGLCNLRIIALFTVIVVITVCIVRRRSWLDRLLHLSEALSTNNKTISLNVNASYNSTLTSQMPKTIRYPNGGFLSQKPPMVGTGLGNLMFMYASLVGIADQNAMTPVYPEDGHLRSIFHITLASLSPIHKIEVTEAKACAYDGHVSILSNPYSNVTVVGYLQSWKYFSTATDRIKQEFTFKDSLRIGAQSFLRNVTARTEIASGKVLFIGVHIRRRDMLISYNVVRGYTVATKEYLVSAVDYFRTQFPSNLLIYVVCSDELDWAKQNFPTAVSNSSLTVFSENRTAAQDMALLSACNHSIITVGTFGWWSAYLIGGRTVYYKNFPAPETHIANIFVSKDYFPAEWIGL